MKSHMCTSKFWVTVFTCTLDSFLCATANTSRLLTLTGHASHCSWCLDCRIFTPNPVCHPQQTMIFIQKLLFPLLVGHCESEHDNWQQSLMSFVAMQRRKAFCPECREDKKHGGWKYSIGIQSPGQEKGTERNWDRDLAEQFSAQGVLQPKPWISPEQFSGRSSVVHLRK